MSTTKSKQTAGGAKLPVWNTKTADAIGRDTREVVETVLVVLILVNLLRMFCAEAYVIPTGSMATTLLGAHRCAKCPECGYVCRVNFSSEDDGQRDDRPKGVCQNCWLKFDLIQNVHYRSWLEKAFTWFQTNPRPPRDQQPRVLDTATGGDRVVVAKYLYEGLALPERWQIPVFKYPAEPKLKSRSYKTNYIKRLVGLPGEYIHIALGDLRVRKPGSKIFEIARKPPEVMMAVRRLVHDNNLQPKDLVEQGIPTRWQTSEGWQSSDDRKFFTSNSQSEQNSWAWLTYQHMIGRGSELAKRQPQLIVDLESYNTNLPLALDWVGDLMVECQLQVSALQGEVTFELVEGTRQYQLVFQLSEKKTRLLQNGANLWEANSPISGRGKWDIRFANFDDQLAVWVNDRVLHVHPVESQSGNSMGPRTHDLRPARIGARGAEVTVANLKLFRDIYYTQFAGVSDLNWGEYPAPRVDDQYLRNRRLHLTGIAHAWDDSNYAELAPDRAAGIAPSNIPDLVWQFLAEADADGNAIISENEFNAFCREPILRGVYQIPDDEFFMLGDNSLRSSDGRDWQETNFVKRNLLLGRALLLYWPPWNWKSVK